MAEGSIRRHEQLRTGVTRQSSSLKLPLASTTASFACSPEGPDTHSNRELVPKTIICLYIHTNK